MKILFINSRLRPLLISQKSAPETWLFSQGDIWLRITKKRLRCLTLRLDSKDERIERLVLLFRRYCEPAEPVMAVCPECDSIHTVHPDEVELPCRECHDQKLNSLEAGGVLLDRLQDKIARNRLLQKHPDLFLHGELAPNHQYNQHSRLERDWNRAAWRVSTGGTYVQVARELNCSVGLVHKRVKELKRKAYYTHSSASWR